VAWALLFSAAGQPDLSAATSGANSPPDLRDIAGHLDEGHIRKLALLNVVSGYGTGLFGREDLVTRQQYAKMLALACGLDIGTDGGELSFAASSEISEWGRPYVAAAVKGGLITGMEDNSFAPADELTRAQAVTMIARFLAGGDDLAAMPGAASRTEFVDDALIPGWARPAINYALDLEIVRLSDDSEFGPNETCTRAMWCRFLSRSIGPVEIDPSAYSGVTFSRVFFGRGSPMRPESASLADCVKQTSDGGYSSFPLSWLMKLDPWGTVDKSRFYGSRDGYPEETNLRAVEQTTDGGCIAAGLETPSGEQFGSTSGLLIKTDAQGRLEWRRTYRGRGASKFTDCKFVDVVATGDGGCLCVGSCDFSQPWLVKVGSRGQ